LSPLGPITWFGDSVFITWFFFSSRRRHTRSYGDWSSDVCSSDLRYPGDSPSHPHSVRRPIPPLFARRGALGHSRTGLSPSNLAYGAKNNHRLRHPDEQRSGGT